MYLFAKNERIFKTEKEKNIFWTIFSRMMSKCLKDKNQPKFFYTPLLIPYKYYARKGKNLKVLKKPHTTQ